jgi:hypothetical protein
MPCRRETLSCLKDFAAACSWRADHHKHARHNCGGMFMESRSSQACTTQLLDLGRLKCLAGAPDAKPVCTNCLLYTSCLILLWCCSCHLQKGWQPRTHGKGDNKALPIRTFFDGTFPGLCCGAPSQSNLPTGGGAAMRGEPSVRLTCARAEAGSLPLPWLALSDIPWPCSDTSTHPRHDNLSLEIRLKYCCRPILQPQKE